MPLRVTPTVICPHVTKFVSLGTVGKQNVSVCSRNLLGFEVSRLEFSFLPTGMILEILGVIIALWCWRKFELNKQVNLKAFIKNGHLLALEGD